MLRPRPARILVHRRPRIIAYSKAARKRVNDRGRLGMDGLHHTALLVPFEEIRASLKSAMRPFPVRSGGRACGLRAFAPRATGTAAASLPISAVGLRRLPRRSEHS